MIFGVDEAGRGCVIGPMVICAAGIDPMKEFELKEMGVRDSKKLTPKAREELYEPVKKLCKTYVSHVPATELDELMERHNLNEIEAIKIAKLLSHAPEGATVFVDSPDNVPENFGRR
ncbi:MAG: ribonuclease HII, partial [Candidatus Micrarchaeota archaeon]|nr:ribonuclease HII [Candidatus Micrarchaeota archaeon]